jgi:hypothetical protein
MRDAERTERDAWGRLRNESDLSHGCTRVHTDEERTIINAGVDLPTGCAEKLH